MKKSFYVNILIIIITAFSFVIGYVEAMELPVYAADEIEWEDLSGDDLVDAFKSYCKSRKLFIDGSVPDAVTSFTSQTFQNLCNTTGIDMTALQAELKKRYNNGVYKYLFTVTGLNGFNRIFAEFLQNNDLAVGDSVDNKTLKSGRWFQDDNGNGCWAFETAENSISGVDYNRLSSFGSAYLFNGVDVYNLVNSNGSYTYTSVVGGQSIPLNLYKDTNVWPFYYASGSYGNGYVYRVRLSDGGILYDGMVSVIYYSTPGKLYFCAQRNVYNSTSNYYVSPIAEITGGSAPQADIYLTTNNTVINNETVINEGDTYIIDDDGTVDDGTGGGSGEGEGGGSGEGEGGGSGEGDTIINFPDIDFNIPDIDFSLSGLTAKFPFCIPFDIVSLLTLLNAEPQAPRIQGSVPIGSWTTWEIDFDFSRFDDFAAIMRGFEIVGFIFFLIGATIRFVKG